MHPAFTDPTLVSPTLAPLLDEMLRDVRPAYADASNAVLEGLEDGVLLGVQSSTERFWIASHAAGVHPQACLGGAHVQCHYTRAAPRDARDILSWIVVQDGYRGGAMVMAHEICHMANRFQVWQRAQEDPELVDPSLGQGFTREQLSWVKATYINEVAARHVAYLGESAARPGVTPMPATGSLVGCATTIARYPEIYNDCGVMRRLLDRNDEGLLRDQVGRWFQGLRGFRFYTPGTSFAIAHARFLEGELAHAEHGKNVPWVVGDGTL